MYDGSRIVPGLLVFVFLAVSPLWYNAASGQAAGKPQLAMPAGETQCIESADYMRSEHMQMLVTWREQVVREGRRSYSSIAYGKSYDINLTGTCLEQCHQDKVEFCDRCHDYSAVTPDCWHCHVVPKEGK